MTAPHIDVPYTTLFLSWAVLLAVACAALAGLAALARRGRGGSRPPRPSTMDIAHLVAEARDLAREAPAIAAPAQRAAASAAVAELRRAEAQRAREAAGQAYDAAQRRYDETVSAWRPLGDAERAARASARTTGDDGQDRAVSRAALAAFRRGDLSVDELREVFRRTGGWDPIQEQREREIGVARAAAQRAHRGYDAAVAAERIATKAASVARVGAQAMAEEAAAAARDASAAREAVEWARTAARRRPRWRLRWRPRSRTSRRRA